MPRFKEPKSILDGQRKWKANNANNLINRKVRRASRMKDFLQIAPEVAEMARISSPDLAIEMREGRDLTVANNDGLVIKDVRDHWETLDLVRHLLKFQFKKIQLVPIKQVVAKDAIRLPRWVQRYFKRPSLYALQKYLHNLKQTKEYKHLLEKTDEDYCASLLQHNPEITPEMVYDAIRELHSAFSSWQGGYAFGGGTNFIVFGLTKDKTKLKVALVDA